MYSSVQCGRASLFSAVRLFQRPSLPLAKLYHTYTTENVHTVFGTNSSQNPLLKLLSEQSTVRVPIINIHERYLTPSFDQRTLEPKSDSFSSFYGMNQNHPYRSIVNY